MWTLIESQETVGISSEMYEEFIFPYYREIARGFGLVYYGCCEPVHSRLPYIKSLPNLRSVSVSPWCDQLQAAQALGDKYVFSRKPLPTLISTQAFDEEELFRDALETVKIARGCPLEIIMKDVHTVNGDRSRMARWVRCVRRACEQYQP